FMGSGSTLVAAARLGRRFVGYDLDPGYVELARARVAEEGVPIERPGDGERSRVVVQRALEEAGFVVEGTDVRLPGTGLVAPFVVRDAAGDRWVVEVGGAFTSVRGGLTSAEAVWRLLGRAHVLRGQGERVLAVTSALPSRRSELDLALRAAGPEAVADVIDVHDPDALDRLRSYAAAEPRPPAWFW
ncbi:MAG: site-specific DNA-methyltransferase, partial [Ilumatobacteraceae bacterium]|nr:site-specific DNA-methyltransferase [Ilumatobacteraceae bacterium]